MKSILGDKSSRSPISGVVTSWWSQNQMIRRKRVFSHRQRRLLKMKPVNQDWSEICVIFRACDQAFLKNCLSFRNNFFNDAHVKEGICIREVETFHTSAENAVMCNCSQCHRILENARFCTEDVGVTVDSKPALKFAGTLLSPFRAPPSALSPQQSDLRLSGPSSGQGTGGGAQTRDRGIPADIWADSLATMLPTPHIVEQAQNKD
ncbi:hypothetical protein PoB_005413700 [Plakobranchus ocellatus]|uniref:Uncharacterized protein n=1 Tax=Plakobranchus ocellatus TaxID=259542 RepID=A0AAV4C8L9_9GAST|nr:hypothetical protein PoB_005413700 [Plakobranchus ocellatus]